MPTEDRFVGCLLGLALGDALGAPYEGGVLERLAWRGLRLATGQPLRWTDDTEMALGCAASLTACGGFDADAMARTWAERASWTRGYGAGARRLLAAIRAGADWRVANRQVFPDGSFGNGAAMRAAPLGLWAHDDPDELVRIAAAASAITHAHPLGTEGGVLIARATALALAPELDARATLRALAGGCGHPEFVDRLGRAELLARPDVDPAEVRAVLGCSVLAHESAVTAVCAFLAFRGHDFEDLVRFVIAVGGDVDTIAAMAGALWGAHRGAGALPRQPLAALEDRSGITGTAEALWRAWERAPR